ncbi:hypothetical protein, partial [Flavobacterium sp. 3-210]
SLVGNAETKTTLVYDSTSNKLTYNGESGTPTVIDLSALAIGSVTAGTNITITGTGKVNDAYIINAVVPQQVINEFAPTSGQTSFALETAPSSLSKVVMYINGVRINKNAFSVVGSTVTYNPANNGGFILGTDQIDNDNVMFDYFK